MCFVFELIKAYTSAALYILHVVSRYLLTIINEYFSTYFTTAIVRILKRHYLYVIFCLFSLVHVC